MNTTELLELKKLLLDLRFIQAAALVAAEISDSKASAEYMRRLRVAEASVERELKKGGAA